MPPHAKSNQRLKDLAALLIAACALSIYIWNVCGSPAFGMLADQPFHLEFAKDFAQSWTDGDFPPHWAARANGGRGGVGFTVYPPFFAFLSACFIRVGFAPVEALRLAFLAATLGSFAAIFYLAQGFLSRRRSLFAASIVLLLPGVTFIALGRGMFPNYAAIGWAALLMGAGQDALLGRSAALNTALMTVAAAGLILTHTLTAYLLAFLLLAVSPVLIASLDLKKLAWAAIAAAAAALMTCWYWVPLIHAGAYTRVGYLAQSHPYLDSTFGAAAGAAGAFREDWAFLNDLGHYIILAQTLLAFLLMMAFLYNDRAKSYGDKKSDPRPPRVLFLRGIPWVAGFALLASTEPVATLLLKLPRFGLIQFAWRWQLLISLWCGVGLASLPLRKASLPAALFAAILLLFFSPMLPPSKTTPGEQRQDLPPAISQEEFEALRPLDRAAYAGNLLELRPNQTDTRYYLPAPFGRAAIVSGVAAIEPQILKTSYRRYSINASTPAIARIETYFAPGWRARLDSQSIEIRKEGDSGLQIVELPKGTHQLELTYQTLWR